ncbi:MAG: hypothetical protein ACTSRZ_08595 [Promethearchaeota archaeon]
MSIEGFIPLSNQLGIPGSSYRVQLGKVNDKWAIRLAKGNEILESKVFEETEQPPNANALVGWVLQVLVIPNLNPYQIAKSIGFIRQEAIRRSEELKSKPKISIKEAKEAKLEELPEDVKRRRDIQKSKQVGWVKEEAPAHVKAKVASKEASKPASSAAEGSANYRILPKVPSAVDNAAEIKPTSSGKDTFIVKVPKGTKKIIIEFE